MAKVEDNFDLAGSRLCHHCNGVTTGRMHGWMRCPVPSCYAAIHTVCMRAHGEKEHPGDARFK